MATLEYIRKDTAVHSLQASSKLLLTVASLAVSLFALDFVLLGAWIVFLLAWWVVAGIDIRRLGIIMKVLIGTYLFLIILQGFTYRFGSTELFRLGVLMIGPRNYAANMGQMKLPYQFTLIFVTGIRFVPLVFQTWNNVLQAQKLRGRDIDKLPLYKKAGVSTRVLN